MASCETRNTSNMGLSPSSSLDWDCPLCPGTMCGKYWVLAFDQAHFILTATEFQSTHMRLNEQQQCVTRHDFCKCHAGDLNMYCWAEAATVIGLSCFLCQAKHASSDGAEYAS